MKDVEVMVKKYLPFGRAPFHGDSTEGAFVTSSFTRGALEDSFVWVCVASDLSNKKKTIWR